MIHAERKDVLKNIALALLATAVLLILERYLTERKKNRDMAEVFMQAKRNGIRAAQDAEEKAARGVEIETMARAGGERVVAELKLRNIASDLVTDDSTLRARIQGIDRTMAPRLGDRRFGVYLSNPRKIGDGRAWGRRGLGALVARLNYEYTPVVEEIIHETGNRYTHGEVWNAIIASAVEDEHEMDHDYPDSDAEEEHDAQSRKNMDLVASYF